MPVFFVHSYCIVVWYTDAMENYEWYQTLVRPTWAPPAWLFGPVWSVLYLLIAISFGFVLYQWVNKKLNGRIALPFVLNLVFNGLFTPLQFGLQSPVLATIDILLVAGTLVWAMVVIWKHYRWVALMNIPYLAWVLFATVLQITITVINW